MGLPAIRSTGTVERLEVDLVNSFGLSGRTGGPDAPATVCLVLGVNGELDVPVGMSFDIPQAEQLIANLQRHIAAVRRAEVN
jgi:hypothetical protein